MVAFKRLFQPERYPSTAIGGQDTGTSGVGLSKTRGQSVPRVPESHPPPYVKVSRPVNELSDVELHFQRIEKQLEELHDNLQKRPVSRSQIPARTPSKPATRNPRHVDLLDAVFSSSQRHQAESPEKLSPVSPYNEDVAERNMTRFLQRPSRKRNIYTRFMSALYQEDVTDKNVKKNKDDTRSRSRSTTMQSQNSSSGSLKPNTKGHKRDNSGRSDVGMNESRAAELAPQAALRPRSRIRGDGLVPFPQETQRLDAPRLRLQRSAPNLVAEKTSTPRKGAVPSLTGHLSVPAAYKQGDTWSNAPIPDSPTLPIPMSDKSVNVNEPVREPPSTTEQRSPSPFCNYSLPKRPAAPRTSSRKNIRDLSINTDLATQGKSAKPSPRAIQPPTPSNHDIKYNPSIAEVMNSPLPSGTPTSVSPLPSTNSKVAEIMDMFKQAYTSTTQAISPHPTFETLQDAIVREVNSHEAFQRVPAPKLGPPFTPSPSQDSFDKSTNASKTPKLSGSGPNRGGFGKESQFSKLIKPGSFKKHRRASEARRSVSTSVPSKVFGRVSTSSGRRRHTDAPPPSPGFFDTPEPAQAKDNEMPAGPKAYMDVPFRSQTTSPASTSKKRSASLSNTLNHAQSIGTLSSHGSSTTPSVYYMRAQTSPSSSDGQTSFSVDDDGDDDVLQLPSPTTASRQGKKNSYGLMHWPQTPHRGIITKGDIILSPSPYSSNGPWAHSVETY